MSKGTYGYAGIVPDPTKGDGKIDNEKEVYDFLKDIPEYSKLLQILLLYAKKATTPFMMETENITALTTEQAEVLRTGDVVVKITGNQKHTYTVSYKNEAAGEMCLTYIDYQNAENVYYEKSEGSWTYIQTDITNIKDKADKSLVEYKNVYIGVAELSSAVIDDAHHHNTIVRGRPIAISNADGYIWVVLPASYSPVVAMSLNEVPMTLDNTTTIDGKEFKIWKSNESVSDSFNLYLF